MTEITDKISGLKYILYSKNQIVLMKLFCSFLVIRFLAFFSFLDLFTFIVFSINQESRLKLDFDKNVLSILNLSKFTVYIFYTFCKKCTICLPHAFQNLFALTHNYSLFQLYARYIYPLKKLFNFYHKINFFLFYF